MIDLLSMTLPELSVFITELKEPAYRAEQIFVWLHKKNTKDFAAMKNLPLSLRSTLEKNCKISRVNPVHKRKSGRDGTVKILYEADGVFIETVLMSYKHGTSICISTQAGCRMGCKFCASGEKGLDRNLTAGEYCAQVYNSSSEVKNIVMMGCGEPLDNFEATLRFIELITHPKGKNIGQRHITLSTCGLVPQVNDLAKKRLQINLAVSLHAPTDEIRDVLMPIAKHHPLADLIPACRHYTETTRRRITFEYALVKGINSDITHAKSLAKLLKGMLCHVNLIPVNGSRFTPASGGEAASFAKILQDNRITATIRRSLGGDIDAACGQLRSRVV